MYINDSLQIENVGKQLKITVGKQSTLSTLLSLNETKQLRKQLGAIIPELEAANKDDIEQQKIIIQAQIDALNLQLEELK